MTSFDFEYSTCGCIFLLESDVSSSLILIYSRVLSKMSSTPGISSVLGKRRKSLLGGDIEDGDSMISSATSDTGSAKEKVYILHITGDVSVCFFRFKCRKLFL